MVAVAMLLLLAPVDQAAGAVPPPLSRFYRMNDRSASVSAAPVEKEICEP